MSREEIETNMFIALIVNYYVDKLGKDDMEKVRGIQKFLEHLETETIINIMDDLDINYVRCVEES